MDESERDQLIERIERLERSVKRGEDGLEVYASGFAKLRVELDAVRALVVSEERQAAQPQAPAPTPVHASSKSAAADEGRRFAAADTPATGTDFAAAARKTGRSASSHCGSARPGLGSRRRQGLRYRGWRRHGARHRLLLRPRSQSRVDWRRHADRARRDRVRTRVHGRTGAAIRYGQYWSALAAVAAGIAGAYATLAAAAVRFDLVPDALALPLAGLIAAVGTTVAIRWRSQVIAGIALLGAALAPGSRRWTGT